MYVQYLHVRLFSLLPHRHTTVYLLTALAGLQSGEIVVAHGSVVGVLAQARLEGALVVLAGGRSGGHVGGGRGRGSSLLGGRGRAAAEDGAHSLSGEGRTSAECEALSHGGAKTWQKGGGKYLR